MNTKLKNNLFFMKAFVLLFLVGSLGSCKNENKEQEVETEIPNAYAEDVEYKYQELLDDADFTDTIEGKPVKLWTLTNAKGMEVTFSNFGQRLVALYAPDKDGNFEDVVLTLPSLEKFMDSTETYFGATIGRYGNRIAGGKFTIDGEEYELAQNNGENALHGGPQGFHRKVWDAEQISDNQIEFTYTSPDGEEGYPGNLDVRVHYALSDANELIINYYATTDKKTPVNLTHHSFFNLEGQGSGSINDHVLMINADKFTPVDAGLIPTGELRDVAGTPFDFTDPKPIGKDIDAENEQLQLGKGYDHNFILMEDLEENADGLVLAATVTEPDSGRKMEVLTNEPAIQFYGGNFLDGSAIGPDGKGYEFRGAFCLETQHYPDSPNQEDFPSTILEPGQEYRSTCVYKFSTVE